MKNQNCKKWFFALIVGAALAGLAGSASAAIVYQDSFNRSGTLAGSAPDVVNTNSNTWSVAGQAGVVPSTNGSVLPAPAQSQWDSPWTTALLPVNGTSGVTLNGSQSFTLSASALNLSNGLLEIGLRNSAGAWYGITVGPGNTGYLQFGIPADPDLTHLYNMSGVTQPVNLALSYDAGNGHLTALLNGTAMPFSYKHAGSNADGSYTMSAAEVQALSNVGIVFHKYSYVANAYVPGTSGATLDNFTLTVVPEPSTWAMLLGGTVVVLIGLQRSRRRASKA
ncbi:MAG: PEP-CTERM sorting domain-containing protein [Terrimicrobiaceae bacterium]